MFCLEGTRATTYHCGYDWWVVPPMPLTRRCSFLGHPGGTHQAPSPSPLPRLLTLPFLLHHYFRLSHINTTLCSLSAQCWCFFFCETALLRHNSHIIQFKVFNVLVLVYSEFCNHHHNLLEYFHHLKGNPMSINSHSPGLPLLIPRHP